MRTPLITAVALFTLTLTPHGPAPARAQDPGRAGTVFDSQGVALVRPVGRERWTPVRQRFPLAPGDLLRVDPRGANVLEIELDAGGKAVLGPGSLAELTGKGELRLLHGEAEVEGTAKAPVTVTGPAGFKKELREKSVLSAGDRAVTTLAEAPRWLTGYRASSTGEWLGALIAKVDGRDVPLHVGYHKVDVVIKDMVAETTIEESFVNSTDARLEGTFRFPLPADGSISGFGMWIGGELVEADIVEKQRARQIYEDILRRKKDPGLLEWNGGNMFTARVFPIEARSEKRVRLRYTQVLPLVGDEMRYRYALRSELLRTHPLRQLQIRIHVDSAAEIADAASTSHEVRARKTAHTAVLEHDASEVTPERDFEARIKLKEPAGLRFVPHRRGEDGYFLLTLAADRPAAPGLRRELVPEGTPLRLLVLADTSGSMRGKERRAQERFLQALTSQLSPKDRFELWSCDVVVQRASAEPMPVDDTNVDKALSWLRNRASLGWTDLDRAFAEVQRRAEPGTVVVYLGDGIGTTGDGDPHALKKRLAASGARFPCHAIAVGTSYEQPVLEALASLGGGSVRACGADDAPECAQALLAEVAQPALKDLKIELGGLRTARVYPERLPNLPAGCQQIVLGRFLPTGKRQSGKATVTATLDGKPVRFSADIAIDEGEEGNSFLPRLWARRHLDALLAQGSSKALQQEIVAFSAEFSIMTPFTSLLVLESDEDRERYGVERRVHMRDGERFFAEARDKANLEAAREQVRLAQAWRMRLKEQAVREIARLGKDLHAWSVAVGDVSRLDLNGFGQATGRSTRYLADFDTDAAQASYLGVRATTHTGAEGQESERLAAVESKSKLAADDGEDLPAEASAENENLELDAGALGDPAREELAAKELGWRGGLADEVNDKKSPRASARWQAPGRGGYAREWGGGRSALTLADLGFPYLAPAIPARPEAATTWDRRIVDLLRRLDRRAPLAGSAHGISITGDVRQIHALRGHLVSRSHFDAALGKAGWLVRAESRFDQTLVSWLHGGERGAIWAGSRLGRVRKAGGDDALCQELPLWELSLGNLAGYAKWSARLAELDPKTVEIAFTTKDAPGLVITLRIDQEKGVLLERADARDGKVYDRTTFSEHVQVAGVWLATRAERRGADDAPVATQRLRFGELAPGDLQKRLADEVASHADALLVPATDPDLAASKQARHEKKADAAQLLRIACHFASLQLWDECLAALGEAKALAGDKLATRLVALSVLSRARRGEQTHALARELAKVVAGSKTDAAPLAGQIAAYLVSVLGPTEQLLLWQSLRAAFVVEGEDAQVLLGAWKGRLAGLLAGAGRPAEAHAFWREVALALPFDLEAQMQWIQALSSSGDHEAARAHAKAVLGGPLRFASDEQERLYSAWVDSCYAHGALAEMRLVCEQWTRSVPTSQAAWTRLVSAMLFAGEEAQVDAWIAAALKAGGGGEAERARFSAAGQLAVGNGYNIYMQRVAPHWVAPLRDAVANALRAPKQEDRAVAQQILQDWRFAQTDGAAEVRQGLVRELAAPGSIQKLAADQLQVWIHLLPWAKTAVDPKLWRDVTDAVRARFDAAATQTELVTFGPLVETLLDAHGEQAEALAFVRAWLARTEPEWQPRVVANLFARLQREPWSQPTEDELLALLPRLPVAGEEPAARRASSGHTLRTLTESLVRMRLEHLLGPVAEREKLPRAELRTKAATGRREAGKGLAERYAAERARGQEPWRTWLEVERLALAATSGADPKQLFGEARELWGSLVLTDHDAGAWIQRERVLLCMFFAATRKLAPPELAERVLEACREGEKAAPEAIAWRERTILLLLALDRVADLKARLAEWIVPAAAETQWRVLLAYLQAEGGALRDAVATLEAARSNDEVGPEALNALAAWNLALGDDAARTRALVRAFQVMPEHQLVNRLQAAQSAVQPRDGQPPQKIEPETLLVMRALLAKASQPGNYAYLLNSLYAPTKDVRLLEALADGVLGHSTEGVYGFLANAKGMLDGVHEEATCDSIKDRLAARAGDAKTDTDRRGLALLMALVERRASEVLNQPGPHLAKALETLRGARKGSYQPGERAAHARLLAALGAVKEPELAKEQVTQGEQLLAEAEEPGERLGIAVALGSIHWSHSRHDVATATLMNALEAHRAAAADAGIAFEAVAQLVAWHRQRAHFADGEKLLLAWQAAAPAGQKLAYADQMWSLRIDCLARGGAVSLGSGRALYAALHEAIASELAACGEGRVDALLNHFAELHRRGKDRDARGARELLSAYARARMRELCARMPSHAAQVVRAVADGLANAGDQRGAVALVLDRIETEPKWLERCERDTWSALRWSLAEWRKKGHVGRDLEDRLLKILLVQIELDLVALSTENNAFYNHHHEYWWAEKDAEMHGVVRKVLELHADSPARVRHCVQVLWGSFDARDEAVTAWLAADRRKPLIHDDRSLLVGWMMELSRHADALPHLDLLIAERPDALEHRTRKMFALFRTGRGGQALAWCEATKKLLVEQKRWEENAAQALAQASLDCRLFEQAAALYREAIPMRERNTGRRGGEDGTLALYWGNLGRALTGLGRHAEAVEAAAAAVVAWGTRDDQRRGAVASLKAALEGVPDLAAWSAEQDQKARKSGEDAPLLRRLVGQVFLARGDGKRALPELRKALELQPQDREAHEALVAATRQVGSAKDVADAMRAFLDAFPSDLALSEALGEALAQAGDAQEAERAFTNVVEAQPSEAGSHRLLAERFGKQGRKVDALDQWQQVVRIRSLDPTGWLALAKCQLAVGHGDEAKKTVQHVLDTTWEAHYGDVKQQAAGLIPR